jgi:hypothetical protein
MNPIRCLTRLLSLFWVLSTGLFSQQPAAQKPMPPAPAHPVFYSDSGIYDIGGRAVCDFIKGEQVAVEWTDIEKIPGVYDFSPIEEGLKVAKKKGRSVIIAITANSKPEYLYDIVPCNPVRWSDQVRDAQGTLMYWHPAFKRAYFDMLKACAEYLKKSPNKGFVAGVRQGFNAIGTDHSAVPVEQIPLAKWICPPGGGQGEQVTDLIISQYFKDVLGVFVGNFSPEFRIFVRADVKDYITPKYIGLFESGGLGWFHTGASMEQNQVFKQSQRYSFFLQYCRPGYTYGFTEGCVFSKFAGDRIKFSFEQWVYWRLLSDLNCGVSYIGMSSKDIVAATKNPVLIKQLNFAAKYAGFHAQPEKTPGAWVALRGAGDKYPGDYTFFMTRKVDASTAVDHVGADTEPYGAWARKLPSGEAMSFDISNQVFKKSNDKKAVSVRVVYFDSGSAEWELRYDAGDSQGKTAAHVINANTNAWKEILVEITDAVFADHLAQSADLMLVNTGGGEVVFHMIEVIR